MKHHQGRGAGHSGSSISAGRGSGSPWGGRRSRAGLVLVLLAALAALFLLVAGCGGGSTSDKGPVTTVAWQTTAAPAREGGEALDTASGQAASSSPTYSGEAGVVLGTLTDGQRKVISNASLQVEVEEGKFQAVFDQATLLADKYGGYILSASSNATGEESIIRSGVVAIRVPSQSLTLALNDAGKLGKVTAQQLDSQDVTEEYVDLQARLKNAQAQEEAILTLLQRAETVEDALRVRDTLSAIQGEIEQLKGRITYLDEHSSFATLTVSVYEKGSAVVPDGGWGFVEALKDAARALVRTINEIIVFLGGALPVLVLLALLAWIVYVIVRAVGRRERRNREAAYAAQAQAYAAQGYRPAPAETAAVAVSASGSVPAAGAEQAPGEAAGEDASGGVSA